MPFTDAAAADRACRQLSARAGCGGWLLAIHDDHREGFVSIINRAFVRSHSPSFAYVAQDAFAGRNWLTLAEEVLSDQSTGMVAFNDGKWSGHLASFGLVKRNWVSKVYGGSLFHNGYRAHYGDTELSLIARAQDAMGYDPNAVLVEVDWLKDGRPVDEQDKALFERRMKSGFDNQISAAALARVFQS